MLKKQIKPNILILCGGKGLRLRPITNDIPKPLVKINEVSLLKKNVFLDVDSSI